MRKLMIPLFAILVITISCKQNKETTENNKGPAEFKSMLDNYYEDRLRYFPLEATANGDYRYNDKLPIDISDEFRDNVKSAYEGYLAKLKEFDRDKLSPEDQISYDVLNWELNIAIERFKYPSNLIPINQFWSLTNTMAQLGSGKSNQPFKTVEDYNNFISRANSFAIWCDTAIANMREGISRQITVNHLLVERTIPQFKDMLVSDVKESIFYMPITNLPESFSAEDKARLDSIYTEEIKNVLIPSYQKLYDFFTNEYLPASRTTIGLTEIPGGNEYYNYLIKLYTTTDLSADSIFNLGMSEVNRIHAEMERVKDQTGFKGDLVAFFKFMNTDKQFFPFKTEEEVISAFNDIHTRMQPQVENLFDKTPRTGFEVRQTEKFRAATASAEYNAGTPDGKRPGIFYTPILDPKKFNTFGMEDLFLHEAIPGHHFQCMLTAENENLPQFRRFLWYSAYGEGWALYTESLGSELGLYTDPYQYIAALSGEMHRAIRLVVDVGMHAKGWTREQAIEFSMQHEGESEASITTEVERYMAIPGQALSYKIGQLKIRQLRKMAEDTLGDKFDIREFHNQVLDDGCLPLDVLEKKIMAWVDTVKAKA